MPLASNVVTFPAPVATMPQRGTRAIKNGVFHTGCCLKAMKAIPSHSVDLILCDLPYSTNGNITKFAWDVALPMEPLWTEYKRIIKPTGSIVLTAVQPFTWRLCAAAEESGLKLKYEWVWTKNRATGALQSANKPMTRHETVLVFSPGSVIDKSRPGIRMVYNPQGVMEAGRKVITERVHEATGPNSNQVGREYTAKTNVPHSVLYFPKDQHGNIHPTQKPVALFEYLIRTYTNAGGMVLDNCAGSGSTAIAAENAGRRWMCIEREKAFAKLAIDRIKKHRVEIEPEDVQRGEFKVNVRACRQMVVRDFLTMETLNDDGTLTVKRIAA